MSKKNFTVLSLASIKLAVAITLLRSITYCPGVSLAVLCWHRDGRKSNMEPNNRPNAGGKLLFQPSLKWLPHTVQ
jgi:hypothetical protein